MYIVPEAIRPSYDSLTVGLPASGLISDFTSPSPLDRQVTGLPGLSNPASNLTTRGHGQLLREISRRSKNDRI